MSFEIYKDSGGEWRWRLKAANHEIIAVAPEGCTSKQNCQHSIDLVKQSSGAPVKGVTA